MTRSQYGPAAGTPRGAAPRLAGMRAPDFIRLDQLELQTLLHVLRDSTALHLFVLLVAHADFTTGELLSTYARFMDLMTPPQPERGPRLKGPTYAQLRRAVDLLEAHGLVRRGEGNQAQGQLRLYVDPRDKRKATPDAKDSRKLRRV